MGSKERGIQIMTEKIKVVITDAQKALKVPKGLRMLVRRCCLAVLKLAGFRGSTEVHVFFTDNEGIKELNQRFFGRGGVEEVLFLRVDRDGVLGEIYLSLEAAQENALLYYRSFQREVVYLTVYGMLGLMGDADSELAEERKQEIMYELGFPMSTAYLLAQ